MDPWEGSSGAPLGASGGSQNRSRFGPLGELLWLLLWELLEEPLGELLWELSWAFVGAFVRALWDTSWAKQGRSMAGRAHIKEKHGIHCASCAEPSEARLRAADACMISLIIVRAILGSNGEGKLKSASLLGRAVTRCFAFIPLARFPFLLSQVFVSVEKPKENHR